MRRTEDKVQGSGAAALVACVAILALMSACRKWDNPLDPTGNRPPTVPSYPRPADSGLGRDSGLVLAWHSFDPDNGDTAYFDIFFSTDSPPVWTQDSLRDTTFQPTDVACSTRYFWRVKAYDRFDTVIGPVWQFTTGVPIVVTTPDTGEQLLLGSQDTIVWIGGAPAVDSTVLYRSVDDGRSWTRLDRATTPGQFVWQVSSPAAESARVTVRAFAATDTMTGISGRFAIEDTL